MVVGDHGMRGKMSDFPIKHRCICVVLIRLYIYLHLIYIFILANQGRSLFM